MVWAMLHEAGRRHHCRQSARVVSAPPFWQLIHQPLCEECDMAHTNNCVSDPSAGGFDSRRVRCSARGAPLPTCAVHKVVSCLRYRRRADRTAAIAVFDPNRPFARASSCKRQSHNLGSCALSITSSASASGSAMAFRIQPTHGMMSARWVASRRSRPISLKEASPGATRAIARDLGERRRKGRMAATSAQVQWLPSGRLCHQGRSRPDNRRLAVPTNSAEAASPSRVSLVG
jgi:hypothetical protein